MCAQVQGRMVAGLLHAVAGFLPHLMHRENGAHVT
jgi:hypothetical protein